MSWNWFAADIDNKGANAVGSTVDDIITVMRGLKTPWFIYTTASSQPSAECFRVMFPLDRPVLNDEFDKVWKSFSGLLPMDPATKDISRLFILPRKWRGRENRIEIDLSGSPMAVDEIVARYPCPAHIPAPRRISTQASTPCGAIRAYVAPSLEAPYVPQRAVSEALSAGSGGRMYRFMVAVAFSALRGGYDVSPADLEAIGHELAAMLGRATSDIRHDAKSAWKYAEQHFVKDQVSTFDRLQSVVRPKGLRAT